MSNLNNTKHIGIVGCSAEGAALCYRTICAEASEKMGEHNHPEITMHTHALAKYTPHFPNQDWRSVAELMIDSCKKVAQCGADFAICPDNTIHQSYEDVERESPIPWLHIARVVGESAKKLGMGKVGILGTRFLMTGPVYPDALQPMGIDCDIPDELERERINEIIFKQLVYGKFPEESRLYFNQVIEILKQRGCEGVVLGCTEIPLLVDPDDCPLPTLDSTRLLARAAIEYAMK